jgi:hypothetical protein
MREFNTIFIEVNGREDQIISIWVAPQSPDCIWTGVLPYPFKDVTKFIGRVAHYIAKGKKTLLLLNLVTNIKDSKLKEDGPCM